MFLRCSAQTSTAAATLSARVAAYPCDCASPRTDLAFGRQFSLLWKGRTASAAFYTFFQRKRSTSAQPTATLTCHLRISSINHSRMYTSPHHDSDTFAQCVSAFRYQRLPGKTNKQDHLELDRLITMYTTLQRTPKSGAVPKRTLEDFLSILLRNRGLPQARAIMGQVANQLDSPKPIRIRRAALYVREHTMHGQERDVLEWASRYWRSAKEMFDVVQPVSNLQIRNVASFFDAVLACCQQSKNIDEALVWWSEWTKFANCYADLASQHSFKLINHIVEVYLERGMLNEAWIFVKHPINTMYSVDSDDSVDAVLQDALLDQDAKKLTMPGVWSFNRIIEACIHRDQQQDAISVYNYMIQAGVKPDIGTYTHLLQGYSNNRNVEGAKRVHKLVKFMGLTPDIVFYTTAIRLFMATHNIQAAMDLLDELKRDKIQPDRILYNVVIDGLANADDLDPAMDLFQEMINSKDPSLQPDVPTYSSLLSAFMRNGDLDHAESWWNHMIEHNITPDTQAFTIMIHGYGSHNKLQLAQHWYHLLVNQSTDLKPTIKTYTAMMDAHIQARDMPGAERWFAKIEAPDAVAYNALVAGYCACGDVPSANRALHAMEVCGFQPTVVTFGMMVDTHLKSSSSGGASGGGGGGSSGNIEHAVDVYREMIRRGIQPSLHIFTSLLVEIASEVSRVVADGTRVATRGVVVGGTTSWQRHVLRTQRMRREEAEAEKVFGQYLRPKLSLHTAFLEIYAAYRAHLLQPETRKLIAAYGVPISIYDTAVTYFATLSDPIGVEQVFQHAVLDLRLPDESLAVRAAKGIGRNREWYGIMDWCMRLRETLNALRGFKTVVSLKSQESLSSPSESAEQQGPILPIDDDEPISNDSTVSPSTTKESSQILTNELYSLDQARLGRFTEMTDRLLLVTYPLYEFQGDRANVKEAQKDEELEGLYVSARDVLRYDKTSRRHFVSLNLDGDGCKYLWQLGLRNMKAHRAKLLKSMEKSITLRHIQRRQEEEVALRKDRYNARLFDRPWSPVKLKRNEDVKFRVFMYLLIRHCERHKLWQVKQELVQEMREVMGSAWMMDESDYRRWLWSFERGEAVLGGLKVAENKRRKGRQKRRSD